MVIPVHRTARFPCPFCRTPLNAASLVPGQGDDARPEAGDFTVCAHCRGVLVFDGEPLAARSPTLAELIEAEAMPEVRAAVAVLTRHGPPRAKP